MHYYFVWCNTVFSAVTADAPTVDYKFHAFVYTIAPAFWNKLLIEFTSRSHVFFSSDSLFFNCKLSKCNLLTIGLIKIYLHPTN